MSETNSAMPGATEAACCAICFDLRLPPGPCHGHGANDRLIWDEFNLRGSAATLAEIVEEQANTLIAICEWHVREAVWAGEGWGERLMWKLPFMDAARALGVL